MYSENAFDVVVRWVAERFPVTRFMRVSAPLLSYFFPLDVPGRQCSARDGADLHQRDDYNIE